MRLSVFARRSFGLSQDKLLPKQSHSSLQGDCFAHFIRSQRREGVGFVFHSSYLLCLFSRLCKEFKRRSNLLINEPAGNRVPNQKCVATSATTLTAFTEAFVVFLRYNVRYKQGLVFTRLCEAFLRLGSGQAFAEAISFKFAGDCFAYFIRSQRRG